MRIYATCEQLVNEIRRDVWEMGILVHPQTMQNKDVRNDDNFLTKEVINYSYCLLSVEDATPYLLPHPNLLNYAEQEFQDRVSSELLNPGNSSELRLEVWRHFLNKRGRHDYTYNERIRNQLQKIVIELKENPDSRQCYMAIWDPNKDIDNLGGIKRVPCSLGYQFLQREGKLDIIYTMRSCDVVTHFGIDVYLAFKTMVYVAEALHIKPGKLYHNIGSLHAYKKDWDTLKQQIHG